MNKPTPWKPYFLEQHSYKYQPTKDDAKLYPPPTLWSNFKFAQVAEFTFRFQVLEIEAFLCGVIGIKLNGKV